MVNFEGSSAQEVLTTSNVQRCFVCVFFAFVNFYAFPSSLTEAVSTAFPWRFLFLLGLCFSFSLSKGTSLSFLYLFLLWFSYLPMPFLSFLPASENLKAFGGRVRGTFARFFGAVSRTSLQICLACFLPTLLHLGLRHQKVPRAFYRVHLRRYCSASLQNKIPFSIQKNTTRWITWGFRGDKPGTVVLKAMG